MFFFSPKAKLTRITASFMSTIEDLRTLSQKCYVKAESTQKEIDVLNSRMLELHSVSAQALRTADKLSDLLS